MSEELKTPFNNQHSEQDFSAVQYMQQDFQIKQKHYTSTRAVQSLQQDNQSQSKSSNMTSGSGTFMMQKTEFSIKKNQTGKSLMSRVFSLKKDRPQYKSKTKKYMPQSMNSNGHSSLNNEENTEYEAGVDLQDNEGQPIYGIESKRRNYNLSDKKSKLDSSFTNKLNKYQNSYNHQQSTVLSNAQYNEIPQSTTPGHIKMSMRALQSSVSALVERAHLSNNTGMIGSNSQWNIFTSTNRITTSNQHKSNIDQNLFPNYDRIDLQNMRISYLENKTQGNTFSPLDEGERKYTRPISNLNRFTIEIQREQNQCHRSSNPITEPKMNENDLGDISQPQSPLNITANFVKNKNIEKTRFSQLGNDIDNNLLQKDEIKLFTYLQETNNEEPLALHVATCNNNSNYTQILISHILNSTKELDNDSVQRDSEEYVNSKDEQQLVEKHLALSQRAKSYVEKWINQLTLGIEEQFAAIHFAAFNGNLKIMQMLQRFGGDIQIVNNQKINCLHFAAQGNQPKIIHYLLRNGYFEVDTPDINGCTALHWACISGSYQSIRYLLAIGANPNIQTNSEGCAPLHMAIRYLDETREIRCIHKMLQYGASLDVKDLDDLEPKDYIENIEDEDLQMQCQDLIVTEQNKSNGLFPWLTVCCRYKKKTLKPRRKRMYFIGLSIILLFQLFSMLFYVLPVITYFRSLCPECRIIMTKRSRHCYSCQKCVERFDHHCDWIDNCVGIKSHQLFMVFIGSLFTYMLFLISLAIDQLAFKFGRGDDPGDNILAIFPKDIYVIQVAQIILGLKAFGCLVFLIPLGSLLILQIRNIVQNMTTYERFSRSGIRQMLLSQSTVSVTEANTANPVNDTQPLHNHELMQFKKQKEFEDQDKEEIFKDQPEIQEYLDQRNEFMSFTDQKVAQQERDNTLPGPGTASEAQQQQQVTQNQIESKPRKLSHSRKSQVGDSIFQNCRIMCCHTDIQSQNDLYYEYIRVQQKRIMSQTVNN
ncbi:dhhc zinc finger domain containing protein [Stylonychia lemnae]|uniref:Dhhc zinc finger domain containing protein n=1 Tax=Stylonychia lemnae TaxID=5949 RepID=A0A078BBL0_STYLE|nr:dhhc zinc finger domain containing protein [Stylonychia lemnae]|eukprot:CDW91601.1 dhhc zinc finger domain containing protein [Stylonychia lemnae]